MGARIAAAMLTRILRDPGPPSSTQSPRRPLDVLAAGTAALPGAPQVSSMPLNHAPAGCSKMLRNSGVGQTPATAEVPEGDTLLWKSTGHASACSKARPPKTSRRWNSGSQIRSAFTPPEAGQNQGQSYNEAISRHHGDAKGSADHGWARCQQDAELDPVAAGPRPGIALQLAQETMKLQADVTSGNVHPSQVAQYDPGQRNLAATSSRPAAGLLLPEAAPMHDRRLDAKLADFADHSSRPAEMDADTGPGDEAAHAIRQQMARAEGMEVALTKVLSWLQNNMQHPPSQEHLPDTPQSTQQAAGLHAHAADATAACLSPPPQPQALEPTGPANAVAAHAEGPSTHVQTEDIGRCHHLEVPEGHWHQRASASAIACTFMHDLPATSTQASRSGKSSLALVASQVHGDDHAEVGCRQAEGDVSDNSATSSELDGREKAAQPHAHSIVGGDVQMAGPAQGSGQLDLTHEMEAPAIISPAIETRHKDPSWVISRGGRDAGLQGDRPTLEQHTDASGQPWHQPEQHNQGTAVHGQQACMKGDEAAAAIVAQAGRRMRFEPDKITKRHISALQV